MIEHRITRMIPLGQIKMDRLPLNKKTLDLIVFLSNGGEVPAIKCQSIGMGKLRIKDGRHRWLAFKMLGRHSIPAKFSTKISRRVN